MARRRPSLRSLVVTTALAGALALPGAAAAKSTLQVGFLDNAYASTDSAGYWNDAVKLHVGFARWDMQWDQIAATRPRDARNPADPAYFWALTDQFVLQAAAHGLQDRVMFTLWKTPKWASSTGSTKARATQMPKLKDWRAFVFAVAKRYSGTYTPPGASSPLPRVTAYETWNEPNAYFAFRPQWQHGVPVSPRNYAQLLKAVRYEVGRAVPFKPTFVAGAMYKQGGPSSLTPVQFMQGLAKAKAKFDVLSMHPYNRVPALGIRDGANESRTNPYSISIGNFESFISVANSIFGRRYPIWITEYGLQTPAHGVVRAATYKQQATFVRQSIAKLKSLPQVERAAWFLIKDDPPLNGHWYTTGLRTSAGDKKPSFNAWSQAAAKLKRSPIK
ncbi:MAG: glycosyl hydrolase [Gaiellales bacterium]